ncbi:MAG: ATP-binding protein [Bryobacteraceae bacterium]
MAVGLSFVIVAFTVWRLWLILRWRNGSAGKYWRRAYVLAIAVTASCWGVMVASSCAHFGVERWATTLLIIIAVGISTGGLTALAPHVRLSYAYLSLIWLPIIVTCIAIGVRETYTTAIMGTLFLAYVLGQAKTLHNGYWSDWRRAVDLAQAKEAAEAASRLKSEFLANISHEIRTPMHGVLGMLAASLESEMNPDQRDLVDTARVSAESLLSLLNDVLDFSKSEAGKLSLENIALDPSALVLSTIKGFASTASRKGLALEFETIGAVPVQVMGDPTRLRQILNNLIGNAIKFTPTGSVTVQLQALESSPHSASVRFSVRDTGIGIPLEKQSLVFDSFAQADGATTRKYGGTGLGLAICRRLTELMGGRILLVSEPGAGSTFSFSLTFELPLHPKPSTRRVPAEPGSPRRPGLSVLLAEDNPVNQRLALRLLEKERHSVEIASNGFEAIDRWQTGAFDLVLMDIQMPGMDGYEATARIRELEKRSGGHTPIVGVTANVIDGDRERCLAAGMDGYLAKPFKAEELYAVIDDHAPDESAGPVVTASPPTAPPADSLTTPSLQ